MVSGITISPTIEQINLTNRQSSAHYEIQITNNLKYTATLSVAPQDFSSLNENGGINLIDNKGVGANNPHGLTHNLSLSDSQLVLTSGQVKSVAVTLNNAGSLAAGGDYTAILFKLQALFSPNGNHVTINQGVVSLLFVRTSGNGTQILQSANPTPLIGSFTTTLPDQFNVLLQNKGNTQSTPEGVIEINKGSHTVSQGQLNINSGMVLPQSASLFRVAMVRTSDHEWLGRYMLKLLYAPKGQSGYTVYQKQFIYINKALLGGAVVLVLLAAAFLFRKLIPVPHYRVRQ